NIVNNFISGLILLFERPIKKGDLIVLNKEWAEVKKIGLRSTVVETFNKAEIIVPNSDLIAQQVTNLTYSNTQARVVIPIGVAYGSDLELVLRILQEEGARHPRALKFPAPSALFIGFGASSLDFQLRLWLSSPDFVLSVPSDVCIAIYKRFAAEGIEIPFPQQDLHLRSVDSSLLQAWRGGPALQPAPPTQQEEQQQGENQQQQTKD
ncbi:MAG: mechanosensitive ion channel, partial [Desulfuromonas thiophila]|nr:mechanosensitive ion channel [Desulfuromonas thiophila]